MPSLLNPYERRPKNAVPFFAAQMDSGSDLFKFLGKNNIRQVRTIGHNPDGGATIRIATGRFLESGVRDCLVYPVPRGTTDR